MLIFENKDRTDVYHVLDANVLMDSWDNHGDKYSFIELPVTNFDYKNPGNNISISLSDYNSDYYGFIESIKIYPQ